MATDPRQPSGWSQLWRDIVGRVERLERTGVKPQPATEVVSTASGTTAHVGPVDTGAGITAQNGNFFAMLKAQPDTAEVRVTNTPQVFASVTPALVQVRDLGAGYGAYTTQRANELSLRTDYSSLVASSSGADVNLVHKASNGAVTLSIVNGNATGTALEQPLVPANVVNGAGGYVWDSGTALGGNYPLFLAVTSTAPPRIRFRANVAAGGTSGFRIICKTSSGSQIYVSASITGAQFLDFTVAVPAASIGGWETFTLFAVRQSGSSACGLYPGTWCPLP